MTIPEGYTDLEPGRIASVVTYLKMERPPDQPPVIGQPSWTVVQRTKPDLEWYRALFLAVGQKWLWFSRLQLADDALRSIIHDPAVDVFSFAIDGQEKGILELDRRDRPDIEIAFIGLMPDTIGRGAGTFLVDQAIRLAWSHRPRSVLVHTCTLDHPRALPLYWSAGFIPYRRAVEVAEDPRLNGTLPRTTAPNLPLI